MLAEMVAEYQKRRDYVVGRLNAMPGVTCATPEGAFYVFPDISGVWSHRLKCKELAKRMLFEHYVVCLPGTDFGAKQRYAALACAAVSTCQQYMTRLHV